MNTLQKIFTGFAMAGGAATVALVAASTLTGNPHSIYIAIGIAMASTMASLGAASFVGAVA